MSRYDTGFAATCTGTPAMPHRWVKFDANDGPCPFCQLKDTLMELQTAAMERHAEIIPMQSVRICVADDGQTPEINSWGLAPAPAPDGNTALAAYPSGTKQILQWACMAGFLAAAFYGIAWVIQAVTR